MGDGVGTAGVRRYLSTLPAGAIPLGPRAAVIFLKMACPSAASQNALPLGDIISLETTARHRQRHRKSNISILILRRLALFNSALPLGSKTLTINLMDRSKPLGPASS